MSLGDNSLVTFKRIYLDDAIANTGKTINITCTSSDYVTISTSAMNIAVQTLDFDSSRYVNCKVTGSFSIDPGCGSYFTFHANDTILGYNVIKTLSTYPAGTYTSYIGLLYHNYLFKIVAWSNTSANVAVNVAESNASAHFYN